MKIFIILSVMLIIHFSFVRSDRKVIDSAAFGKHALVVSAEALKSIDLDESKMEIYARNLRANSGKVLDTAMFSQIIRNAGSPDTLAWNDEELRNLLVVESREEKISKKYAMDKLNLSGKKQIRYFTRQINRYNETAPASRTIFHFSKPVYSNSGNYAIVQWHNGEYGISGEGGD